MSAKRTRGMSRDGPDIASTGAGAGRQPDLPGAVMTVKGRASHAGVRREDGCSAILEMARQILRIEGKTDYVRGKAVLVP